MIRIASGRSGVKRAAVALFVPIAVVGLAPVAHAAASAKPMFASVLTDSTTVGMTTSASAALAGSYMTAGGNNGSITFTLFGPYGANATPDCKSGKLVYTSAPPVPTNGDGTYGTGAGAYTITTAGIYEWVASYSGDVNNNAFASNCGDAQVVAAKASPTVVTTPATP